MTILALWLSIVSGVAMRPNVGCASVTGDRITGSDLAKAIPQFSALPQDLPLGYAPLPWSSRVFREDELRRIAKQNGMEAQPFPPVCFSWPATTLGDDRAIAAMRNELQLPDAKIEIQTVSPRLTPPGTVVFPRAMLSTSWSGKNLPVPWHGYVQYTPKLRFPVTAYVRVSVLAQRVTPIVPIKQGEAIQKDQVREETFEEFPGLDLLARSTSQVAGLLARRRLVPGIAILKADLMLPLDIHRGDRVEVEVRGSRTRLSLEGRAESGGRMGDSIQVRNLQSGKLFMARVEAKDRVVVLIPNGGAE
jgi:flagella basal body P-ring formation protein FlgA